MTEVFEELFRAWCPPYNPDKTPAHLLRDPVTAYGQYAFEQGFKLAMQLAVVSLEAADLQELR